MGSKGSSSFTFIEIPKRTVGVSGFQFFINWILFLTSVTTAFIPYLTLFWCNPSSKNYEKRWPLAIILGGVWVAGLIYLSGWWAIVLGNVFGLPSEMMGLLVLGPMLSFNNLVMIPDKKKKFIWQGIFETITADLFLGMLLPYVLRLLYTTDSYSYQPLFDSIPFDLPIPLLLLFNVALGLLFPLFKIRGVRIAYGVILIFGYFIFFLGLTILSIYQILPNLFL